MNDQLPLFDSPASPMRRRAPAPRTSPIRYTRFKSKGRRLCDDCCLAIHELGPALAPYPNIAIWRRTDDTSVMVLCQAHKDERHERESRQ